MEQNTVDTKLVAITPETPAFAAKEGFEHAQRVAKMLSSSDLVPKRFQNNIQNTMIALELANRIGASPIMVMQNLNIIQGTPSWSSSFVIASINASKKFSPLRYRVTGKGDTLSCIAWAYEGDPREVLEGPEVTMQMAKDEGWLTKQGSKWKTMPDLMIRYRAAAFFGRLYAPEILMGMHTTDEVEDMQTSQSPKINQVDKERERLMLLILNAADADELELLKEDAEAMDCMEQYNQKHLSLSKVQ